MTKKGGENHCNKEYKYYINVTNGGKHKIGT